MASIETEVWTESRILYLSGFVWRSCLGRQPRLCGFTRGQVPSQADVMAIKGQSEQPGLSMSNRPGRFMRLNTCTDDANKNTARLSRAVHNDFR